MAFDAHFCGISILVSLLYSHLQTGLAQCIPRYPYTQHFEKHIVVSMGASIIGFTYLNSYITMPGGRWRSSSSVQYLANLETHNADYQSGFPY